MNNELNTQNKISVRMNKIKIKYEDLVLTDSDSETEMDTNLNKYKYSFRDSKNNSVFENIRNKHSNSKNYKKINMKIFRITKYLKKIHSKVNYIEKKKFVPTYLSDENKHTNIFVKNSINFLETNYISIVNKQIEFIKKSNTKYNFENIYVIRFPINSNYNKIIDIYKKILLDLNDDYKLLFLNPIFDFNILNNFDLQTVTFFKNKVNYKKRILDEYFKNKINYYKNINIIIWLLYNFIGCGLILLISIKYENIKNFNYKKLI